MKLTSVFLCEILTRPGARHTYQLYSTPNTARSIQSLSGQVTDDAAENIRLKKQLDNERETSELLKLQAQDLLAERQGLQEALKAALMMMSDRHNVQPTPRNPNASPINLGSDPTQEIVEQLEAAERSLHTSEKTMSDLVYELASMVQQRDAALLALATVRGEENYSDVGSESRSTTPAPHITKVPFFPNPVTVPEDGPPAEEVKPTVELDAVGARGNLSARRAGLRKKGYAGSVGSTGSGGKISFV